MSIKAMLYDSRQLKCRKFDPQLESDSQEDEEIDPRKEHWMLYDSWVKLSNENLQLLKDEAMLKTHVNIMELEQPTSGGTYENAKIRSTGL